MLKRITLSHFKKHTHLAINFDDGVSCLRGHNAVGKSTVLKAIGFALFGAAAAGAKDHLRTWGSKHPMSVDLTLDLPDYPDAVITRTEKNAKVLDKDGNLLASGHTPVTAFLEEQLGLNAKDLRTLMISPQGETQGLLDMGAAALERRVSEIAKSHVIDKVLALIGTDVARIDGELEGIGEVPDIHSLQVVLAASRCQEAEASATVDTLQTEVAEHTKLVTTYEAEQRRALRLQGQHLLLQQKVEQLTAANLEAIEEVERIEAELEKEDRVISQGETTELAERVKAKEEDLRAALNQRVDYLHTGVAIEKKQKWLDDNTPKLAESLTAESIVAELQGEIRPLQVQVRNLQVEQATLKRHVEDHRKALTDSVCPTCHREYAPGAKEQAAADLLQQQAELDDKTEEVHQAQQTLDEVKARLAEAEAQVVPGLKEAIDREQAELADLRAHFGELVLGGDPTARVEILDQDLQTLKVGLAQITEAYTRQQGLIKQQQHLERIVVQKGAELESAQLELANLPPVPDLATLEDVIAVTKAAQADAAEALEEAKEKLHTLQTEIALLDQRIMNACHLTERRKKLETQGADIKELQTYLRKNRGRLMADTWDALLQYTSALVASVTEGRLTGLRRTNGDFLITEDEREIPCDELSGGQKSIVGICLRLALSQVFYGKGLTLLLDEPAADLADDMAAALSGMLRGLQHQVVLVTHRNGDAAVADEVIEIGG